MSVSTPAKLLVDLPAGGQLELANADEVALWDDARDRYIRDYGLVKTNDLVLLGAVLSQTIAMYRAQQLLIDPKKAGPAVTLIGRCAEQIREIEKALGIDKKTREAGGQHTVKDYVTNLKKAAHAKGIHISDRVKAYEAVMMEARWKIRVLRNGDAEDRRYHNLTERTLIDWLEKELAEIEEKDKAWSKTVGKVFVGRL